MKLVERPLHLHAWLAALLCAAIFLCTRGASAADPGDDQTHGRVQPHKVAEARAQFASGMKHFDEGNYTVARDEMEKAYAMAPSYRLLYNLGLVHRQLNDPARAIQT